MSELKEKMTIEHLIKEIESQFDGAMVDGKEDWNDTMRQSKAICIGRVKQAYSLLEPLEEEKVAHCLLKARQEWVMQQGAKESVVLCEMQAKAICQRFRRGGK